MSSAATDPLSITEPQPHFTPFSLFPTVIRGLLVCALPPVKLDLPVEVATEVSVGGPCSSSECVRMFVVHS